MWNVEFIDDIPFPKSNIIVYKEIYYLEQWMRRILIAALFARHGEKWFNTIPSAILDGLKQKQKQLKGKIIFDVENNSNVLWLTTLEELRRICLDPEIWPIIRQMTAFNETEFTEKLSLLREIRNIIGHNRAVTEQTQMICESLVAYFRDGVNIFKIMIHLSGTYSDINKSQLEKEANYMEGDDFGNLRNYLFEISKPDKYDPCMSLYETSYFRDICLRSFEGDADFCWLDIARILDEVREIEACILAIAVHFKGNTFSILWPKSIPIERQNEIIKKSVLLEEPDFWIKTPYVDQSPRFLGDPKIWFIDVDNSTPFKTEETSTKEIYEPDNIILFPKPS